MESRAIKKRKKEYVFILATIIIIIINKCITRKKKLSIRCQKWTQFSIA